MYRTYGMLLNLATIPPHVLATDNPLVLEAIAKAREFQSKHPMFQAALAEQSPEALEVRRELTDRKAELRDAAALLLEAERELAASQKLPPPKLGDLLHASRELKASSIAPTIQNAATLPAPPAATEPTRSKPMSDEKKQAAIDTLRGDRGITWTPADQSAAENLSVEQIGACRSSGLSPRDYAAELAMQPPAETPPPKPKAERKPPTPHDAEIEQLQMRGVPIDASERAIAESLSLADLRHCRAMHLRPSQYAAAKVTASSEFKA